MPLSCLFCYFQREEMWLLDSQFRMKDECVGISLKNPHSCSTRFGSHSIPDITLWPALKSN